MRVITIDCARATSPEEFWDAYVAAALPGGRGYFGRNLDAFWDAVSAGGPGWPGNDCELRFVNTAPLKSIAGGKFYSSLKDLAAQSNVVPIHVE
jgi:RNAse (barnase) inhibitor barstar